MKNIILITAILFSINLSADLTDDEKMNRDIQNQEVKRDLKGLSYIKEAIKESKITDASISKYGREDFKNLDSSNITMANDYFTEDIKFDTEIISDGDGEKVFSLGCNGLTYEGQVEQVGISYLELLRDTFKDYTDPYVCSSADSCLNDSSKCGLEDYAFAYAMSLCTVEVVDYMMSGEDSTGNKIAGNSMADIVTTCAGRAMDGTKVAGGMTKANSGLMEGGANMNFGLSGVFKEMGCVAEGIGELGLIKFYDSCLKENKAEFIDFVLGLSDINFGIDLSVQKFRIETCESALENNGNTLSLKGGLFDIFGNKPESGFTEEYKNLNGLLISNSSKKVLLVDDIYHSKLREELEFPLEIPKVSAPKIEKSLNKLFLGSDKLKNNFYSEIVVNDCITDSISAINKKLSIFLASPNLGISEIILDINLNDIVLSKDFIYNYKNFFLSDKCNVVIPEKQKVILEDLNQWEKKILNVYFKEIEKIVTSEFENGNLINEDYLSNKELGELNKQIILFNNNRITKRTEQYLKSKIVNTIYNEFKPRIVYEGDE